MKRTLPHSLFWQILGCLVLAALLAGCGGSSSGSSNNGSSNTGSDSFQPAANQAVIYFKRSDGDYTGWGLHLWGASGAVMSSNAYVGSNGETTWADPLPPTGISAEYGAYYVVDFEADSWTSFNFIVHKGDEKDLGGLDQSFSKSLFGNDVYSFSGVGALFAEPLLAPPVALEGASAHWLTADTLVMNVPAGSETVQLFASADASIEVDASQGSINGGSRVALASAALSDALKAKYPHLAGYQAWTLTDTSQVKTQLKGQLIAAAFDDANKLTKATKVQIHGVLDDVYADAAQGAVFGAYGESQTTFAVWAPTAQALSVSIYNAEKSLIGTFAMTEDSQSGVWQYVSADNEDGNYYRYQVDVYHYLTGKIERLEVTDPYALSLSMNSRYAQVVNLSDAALKPSGWDDSDATFDFQTAAPEDIVIYEAHIRDFSVSDALGVPAEHGKYRAFADASRESVAHLARLKAAGLTHLHLLPAFDIATINEDPSQRIDLDNTKGELCALRPSAALCGNTSVANSTTLRSALAACDPLTGCAQALMNDIRDLDSFNWGYDPFHYTVPEGSYASDAEGSQRILEFREMVQALHAMGLNVVMDVVYNHTNASGLNDKSVLDKLVPGYYHRLNPDSGAVENSTCCDNTATETRMFQKLMEDSLVVWARDYKIDSFRFDIMGHHPKQGILDALTKVRAVREHVYFYGEGWNFGEVANNARFEQGVQANMAGTEIGTFSDRVRDAVRGGGPFDSQESLRRRQGFANGLYTQPNALNTGAAAEKAELLHLADLIRLSMAGNLTDYVFTDAEDQTLSGSSLDYAGQKAGYAQDPADMINYISKHDNQTLWDNNMYKMAATVGTGDRVRMQLLGLSVPLLSQGIPFLHMGSDLLRSKSMERDSYDSGDWYNRVDFSQANNNWHVGLPREDKDGANWPVIQTVLADSQAEPASSDIGLASAVFLDFLKIRQRSPLFRLQTAAEIKARVDFHNTGSGQVPGVIVMSIDDGAGQTDLDANYDAVVVMINATPQNQTLPVAGAEGFELIDVQHTGQDAVVTAAQANNETFTVPALTTAVFVKPQQGVQGVGVPVTAKSAASTPPYGSTTLYFRGDMNGWGTSDKLAYVGQGQYQITVNLEAGLHHFKIADAQWNAVNLGGDTPLVPGDSLLLVTNGGDIAISLAEATQLRFTLNASEPGTPMLVADVVAD